MNNSLREIAEVFKNNKSVLIFPHVNPDGDCIGSSVALLRALRLMGKECFILLEDEIPNNLKFMDKGYITKDKSVIENPDICVAVDCSVKHRFESFVDKFEEGKIKICIDHHETKDRFSDYNYIEPKEAATGQIIFDLIKEMGAKPDKEIGEAIYAAILTDTGTFQNSNTTKKSFQIAAELSDWGTDYNKVSIEIFENVRAEAMLLKNMALGTIKFIGGKKGALIYISREMLEKSGATMDEGEKLSQELRALKGVEYAAVLKEYEENLVKVSMRAKTKGDVKEIAEHLGGGGHIKAAGATFKCSLDEARKIMEKELEEAIAKL